MADKLPDADVNRLIDAVDHTRIRTEEHLQSLVEQAAEFIEHTSQARHDEFIDWLAKQVKAHIESPTKRCFECNGTGEKERGKLIRTRHKCDFCGGTGRIAKLKLNTKF